MKAVLINHMSKVKVNPHVCPHFLTMSSPQYDERQFFFFAFVSVAKLIFLQSSYVAQYPDSWPSIRTEQ